MATFKTFTINGKSVKTLFLNGKQIKIQGDEPSGFWGLSFTAEEANSTVKLQANGSAPVVNLKTSTDDGTTWTSYTVGDTITLANIGDKVCFIADGSNASMGSTTFKYNGFVMTGKISASGNINSLLENNKETARTISMSGKTHCYDSLFRDCTSLTIAPELPATTLANYCYSNMFYGCTSLTQAPELPATALAYSCYEKMFYGCTSLTQAPELPATRLTNGCYSGMFQDCTSLTQAPELPATTLDNYCYENMFRDCTSLTQAPELPATRLADTCYHSMFQGCTSLTTAPALPATTLDYVCYDNMFFNCNKINDIYIPNLTEEEYNTEKSSKFSGDLGREGSATFHFKV